MSGFSLEYEAHNMVPYRGLYRPVSNFQTHDWAAVDGSRLSGASNPKLITQSSHDIIEFPTNGSAAAPILLRFVVPDDFDPAEQALIVEGLVRKKDPLAVDENNTLKLQAQINAWKPNDAAAVTLATPASVLLGAPVAAADLTGWTSFALDLGARMRAEGKRIAAGYGLRVYLSPDAVVGNADMTLQVTNLGVFMRRHLVPLSNSRR